MAASEKNSTASLDNLARTSFPSTLPTATASPVEEKSDPTAAGAVGGIPSDHPTPGPSTASLAMSKGDEFVSHLLKVIATPGGTDRLLCSSYYTLSLLSAIINNRLENATEKLAAQFAAQAEKALLPGETVVATFQAPPIAALLASLSVRSKKLAAVISEFRIFTRLWGLLGMYAWGKSVAANPPKDKVLRVIAYSQVLINTCFQFYENRAYLAGKGVLLRNPKLQLRDWLYSSRCWCIHTTLEFVRLYRLKMIWDKEKKAKAVTSGKEGEGAWWSDSAEAKAKRAEEERLWWKDLIVNAAYYPMTFHYSMAEGFCSPLQLGVMGCVAGGMGLREVWRKTA